MKKIFAILTLSLLALGAYAQEAQKATSADYGYKQTGFMSTPKLGAYIIGSYKYSDLATANGGPGFGARLIRAYVDGSIFNDFKYRVQLQFASGTPHVKDYFIEWAKYKEFSVKMGQFKRAFTFENPMNPWDVGVGDFSFLVQKFAGMGDRLGEANMGGRDQGIQVQGDLLPMGGEDGYRRGTILHSRAPHSWRAPFPQSQRCTCGGGALFRRGEAGCAGPHQGLQGGKRRSIGKGRNHYEDSHIADENSIPLPSDRQSA